MNPPKNNKIHTSIIITTFNREKNIFELINLVNKQVRIVKNMIEIIICDSNSKKKIIYIKLYKAV